MGAEATNVGPTPMQAIYCTQYASACVWHCLGAWVLRVRDTASMGRDGSRVGGCYGASPGLFSASQAKPVYYCCGLLLGDCTVVPNVPPRLCFQHQQRS